MQSSFGKNISIIAAIGKKRELGFNNQLLWKLPDDLKKFREITRGHAVIMGRKTFESIGRPLPDRKNIIITRNSGYKASGCMVVGSIKEALREAGDDKEVFIIGGAEVYNLALPFADRMYLTHVDGNAPADTYFPEFDEKEWQVVTTEVHGVDDKHKHGFIFKIYERAKK